MKEGIFGRCVAVFVLSRDPSTWEAEEGRNHSRLVWAIERDSVPDRDGERGRKKQNTETCEVERDRDRARQTQKREQKTKKPHRNILILGIS